jgi:hypothetical protein
MILILSLSLIGGLFGGQAGTRGTDADAAAATLQLPLDF